MIKAYIYIIFVALLVSCSSTTSNSSFEFEQFDRNNSASIYVYRLDTPIVFSEAAKVFINFEDMGTLNSGEYIHKQVTPGTIGLYAEVEDFRHAGVQNIFLDVEVGKTYYFAIQATARRADIGWTVLYNDFRAELIQIEDGLANHQLRRTRVASN